MLLFHHPALSKAAGQINGGCFYLGDGKAVNCKQQGNLLIITLVIIVTLLALGLALSKVLSGAAQQNTIEYYGARLHGSPKRIRNRLKRNFCTK